MLHDYRGILNFRCSVQIRLLGRAARYSFAFWKTNALLTADLKEKEETGEEEEEEGEKGKEVEKEEEGEEEKVAVMVMVKKGTIKEQKSLASKGDAFPMHYRSCYILASSPNIGQKSFGKAEKADFQVPLQET